MLKDFRLGARTLLKDRGFTAAAVLTLALGIASTSIVFTILNAVLLRDLPFAEPDRIVEMQEVSYLDLQDWQAGARTFDGISAFDEQSMSVADEGVSVSAILAPTSRQMPLR